MKRTRRRFDRDFKISVIAELEAGKPIAQVAREHGIHPSLPCRWKEELAENPHTPAGTLRHLAEDPDQSVQKAVRRRMG